MKYLSNYIEEETTKCLRDTGAFFAFSDKQFDEQKKDGVKYVSCGMGLICPKDNVDKYIETMKKVISAGIAQDIAENGKDGVIIRELANHEAYYTGDIQSTCEALNGYNFTEDEILTVFKRENAKGQPLCA